MVTTKRRIPTAEVRPGHTVWSAPFGWPVVLTRVGHRKSDQTAIFVYVVEVAGRLREYRIERKLSGMTTVYEDVAP